MALQPITESSGRLTTDRLTTHDSSLLTDSPTHRLPDLRDARRSQSRVAVRVRDVHTLDPLIGHLELEGLDGVEIRHVLGDDLLDALIRRQALGNIRRRQRLVIETVDLLVRPTI